MFDAVGTPRRWLWPVLRGSRAGGIVFPVWAHDVPFDVVNAPADGVVRAERTFHFAARRPRHARRDRGDLGPGSSTCSAPDVGCGRRSTRRSIDGRLELRSRGAGAARRPGVACRCRFAPRVHLVERRDGERQRVELTMTMPVIGRIYEYAGSFSYRIEHAMRIVIAGASGFMGRYLVEEFRASGDEVLTIGRSRWRRDLG